MIVDTDRVTTLTLRASGAADATQVWQRYAQIDCWPEWAPQIRRIDSSAEQINEGVTGRVVGIAGIGVSFAIDAVDPEARTWSWRVRLGPISLRLEHGVQARPQGCRTWLRVSGPTPIVVGYAPVAALALRRLVAP